VLQVQEDESRPTVGRLNRERALEVLADGGIRCSGIAAGGRAAITSISIQPPGKCGSGCCSDPADCAAQE